MVVDLDEQLTNSTYRPTAAQREQATLIHETCAFPYCNQRAHLCDLDLRRPYDKGGGTDSINPTPLCRGHHRSKTHHGWTYERLSAGEYHWRSPHGFTFHTTPHGTVDTTDGVAGAA